MELEINEKFANHYNQYRSREEAAKTKKTLKRQIKEIEESSSSSDSEYDEEYQKKYVEQCNLLLKEISTKGKKAFENKNLFCDIEIKKKTEKIEKPVYARDLNRQILLEDGAENEQELEEIEKCIKLDSEEIINEAKTFIDLEVNMSDDSDEDFLKPSTKPPKYVFNNTEKEKSDAESDSYIDHEDIEESQIAPSSSAIKINRDRRLETVRVSKTATRTEKRQLKKERKEKELKDKMKKLQEIQHKSLQEKIEKIKKVVPQAAEELILDHLDEDFDIDEVSKKLTAYFEQQDASMPIDEEKPIFSDDSDSQVINYGYEQEDCYCSDDEKIPKKETKIKNSDKIFESKKNSYFTNLEIENTKISNKKMGIIKKNNEVFDPEKHGSFSKFIKKNFDFCCEDLIMGKDDGDDILCKFKYREVEKQDFGLNTEEIMLADIKELNKWASLKKIIQIRTKAEEEKDSKFYEKMKAKKCEVLRSLYCKDSEEENEEQEQPKEKSVSKAAKKRMRKQKNKRKLNDIISENELKEENVTKKVKGKESDEPKKKKRKSDIDEMLNVKGENIKKPKNKSKKKDTKVIDGEKTLKKEMKIDECVEKQNDIKVEGQKHADKVHKKKKSKKDKNDSSAPILNSNRLKSLNVKEDYYRYVVMKK